MRSDPGTGDRSRTAARRRRLPAMVVAALAVWLTVSPDAQQTPGTPPFDAWLEEFRAEALAAGVSEATVDAALATVEAPKPEVVEQDRAQPERTRTLEDYVAGWVTARNVRTARARMAEQQATLTRVASRYDVPTPVLVSVWGLESNFGRITGSHQIVQALATLAYDPRRSRLFRAELLDALRILDRGHVALADMTGSWAGAMGQPQFMPSSYLRHAVDFNGDGAADIWRTPADVFASMANYLINAGWRAGERWGREVRISRTTMERIEAAVPQRSSGCGAVRQLSEARPLAEWASLGVERAGGGPLPTATMTASLLRGQRRYFLVYRNYHAILDYNCSNAYAVSVGLLSDRLW